MSQEGKKFEKLEIRLETVRFGLETQCKVSLQYMLDRAQTIYHFGTM